MRFQPLLNVLVFRATPRVVPGSEDERMVRRGMRSLLRILKPNAPEPLLPESTEKWCDHVFRHWMGGKHLPVETSRRIWVDLKGGFGARDFFDMCQAVQAKAEAHPVDALIVFTFMGTLASLALGGNYGASVARAFRIVATNHFPRVLDASVRDIEAIASEFSTEDRMRAYADYLMKSSGMSENVVAAGIYNHFVQWRRHRPENVHTMHLAQLSEHLESDPQGMTYLDECLKANDVRVQKGLGERLVRALSEVESVWESTIFASPHQKKKHHVRTR